MVAARSRRFVEGACEDEVVSRKTLGPLEWAAEQFGAVDLGDRRLNKRVVTVAAAMAADPAGSIPKQNRACWAGTKGAYRLFDHERATFETLSQQTFLGLRRQSRCCDCHRLELQA